MKKVMIFTAVFVFIIFGGIGFLRAKSPKNTPISHETFIEVMSNEGYELEEIKEGGIKKDFPNLVESYVALKKTERENLVKVLYCRFASAKEAQIAFLSIHSTIKSDGVQTFEFLNQSRFFGNTQYYEELSMPVSGWTTQMWCVDDTLIIAQSNEFPMLVSEIFKEKFGYRYFKDKK